MTNSLRNICVVRPQYIKTLYPTHPTSKDVSACNDLQLISSFAISCSHFVISIWIKWVVDDLEPMWRQRQVSPLRWRHNGRDGVWNHQPRDCLLKCLFRRRSKKTSELRVTGLCAGNSPGTGEFPAQRASNAENVSIWWRHYAMVNSGL